MAKKKKVEDAGWLIEFRMPEGVFYAGKFNRRDDRGRLGIAISKKNAERFDTAEIAGSLAATFHGRLFQCAYVVEDKDEE